VAKATAARSATTTDYPKETEMATKRHRTQFEFVVFGPAGAVEMSLLNKWTVFHRPVPDDDGLPCELLEMPCDAEPLFGYEVTLEAWRAAGEDDEVVFAELERQYAAKED
jgi:hypothetical protein